MDGRNKPDMNIRQINVGSFAYVHTDTSNTMKSRSLSEITLRPANKDGAHYFINLERGKSMNIYIWDEVPIMYNEIKWVNTLAKNENKPVIENEELKF